MKRFGILLTILLATTTILSAQSQFEHEFGKDYQTVWEFVKGKHFVNSEKTSSELITASTDKLRIQYHFANGSLYKIETEKHFNDKDDAEKTYDSFKQYYQLNQARITDRNEKKGEAMFAALKGSESYEVSKLKVEKVYTVRQVVTDLAYAPENNRLYASGAELAK